MAKLVYAVIELAQDADFDLSSEADQDELADDLLRILPGVVSATVYTALADLIADNAAAGDQGLSDGRARAK